MRGQGLNILHQEIDIQPLSHLTKLNTFCAYDNIIPTMNIQPVEAMNVPIFVVGPPRSGTTLLAALLGAHSNIACGTETRFFHALAHAKLNNLLSPRDWPEPALDFLYATKEEGTPIPVNYGLDRDQIKAYLSSEKPSIRAILNAILQPHTTRLEKRRWLEKTPVHIVYVDHIRKYFPESPIIRIIRDPRDTAISNAKIQTTLPRSFTSSLLAWRESEKWSSEFFASDKLAYTVRYEDLVSNPEQELRKLCEFIGEAYEQNMLDTSESYYAVNSIKEEWKTKVATPLDKNRTYAWQKTLAEDLQIQAECIVGDIIKKYGYESTHNLGDYINVFPLPMLAKYPSAMKWVQKNKLRLWQAYPGEPPSYQLYIGNPATDHWFYGNRLQRVSTSLRITVNALKARFIHRRKLHWVTPEPPHCRTGVSCKLVSAAMRITATMHTTRQTEPDMLHWLGYFSREEA